MSEDSFDPDMDPIEQMLRALRERAARDATMLEDIRAKARQQPSGSSSARLEALEGRAGAIEVRLARLAVALDEVARSTRRIEAALAERTARMPRAAAEPSSERLAIAVYAAVCVTIFVLGALAQWMFK